MTEAILKHVTDADIAETQSALRAPPRKWKSYRVVAAPQRGSKEGYCSFRKNRHCHLRCRRQLPRSDFSTLGERAQDPVIKIDTLGTYNTVKAALPHVSAALHYLGTPYQAHISTAKAAVDAPPQVIAVEGGPRGIRSSVIAPDPIGGTGGMNRLSVWLKPESLAQGINETAWPADRFSGIPVPRLGDEGDIANAAVFLFTSAASFVSGAVLVVGGASEHVRSLLLTYPLNVLHPEKLGN